MKLTEVTDESKCCCSCRHNIRTNDKVWGCVCHCEKDGHTEKDVTRLLSLSALKKQEQDRWIPVTERLPEEDGEYLVTFDSGYAEDYGVDPIGIAPFEVDCEGFGIWQERFHPVSLGSLGSEWVDIPVTAWRPLPKPYTEEES